MTILPSSDPPPAGEGLVCLTSSERSEPYAWEEVRGIDPAAAVAARPAPGIRIARVDGGFARLSRGFAERPPVFVRHVCPLDIRVALEGDRPADLDIEAAGAYAAARLDPARSFSVQTRAFPKRSGVPFAVNEAIAGALLRRGLRLDVRAPEQVVSVVCLEAEALVGASTASENLSDWAGGECRFARDEGMVGRAEFKLLEALRVFQIELPASGIGLDLGAAPGGWTRVLVRGGLRVDAVDPASLHPSIFRSPGVAHRRTTAGRFLDSTRSTYDVLLCDVRADAGEAVALLLRAADRAAPGAPIIATLKLPGRGAPRAVDRALDALRARFDVVGARQLFHNRSEVTVALRRR